ncbi:hypothetical protein C0J52_16870 [Blattella germanica]|nr:hypothetical protein C0J52_16870 [Blattella germanica]
MHCMYVCTIVFKKNEPSLDENSTVCRQKGSHYCPQLAYMQAHAYALLVKWNFEVCKRPILSEQHCT